MIHSRKDVWVSASTPVLIFLLYLIVPVLMQPALCDSVKVVKRRSVSTAEALYRRGVVSLAKGDLDAAESSFKESLRLDPNQASTLLGMADIAVKRNQPRVAESYLNKAAVKEPQRPEMQRAWGRYYYSQRKFADAETAFKKAIALDSKQAAFWLDLAELYLVGKKDIKEATKAYRSALALDPGQSGAHYGLGLALVAEKNYDQALQEFDAALNTQPDLVQARLARGEVFEKKGEENKAIAEYQEILKLNPSMADAHLKLGMAFERKKQPADAAKSYIAAIQLNPKLALAYNNLAWLSAENRTRLDEAVVWAKRAVELSPTSSQNHDTLGWVYRSRGELDKANLALNKAASLKPEIAEIYYHLGIVSSESGRGREAITSFNKALALNRDFDGSDDARKRLAQLSTGKN